jgi:integrase
VAVENRRKTFVSTLPANLAFAGAWTNGNASWEQLRGGEASKRGVQVDLDSGEIAFTTRKTGRRIVLPLVQPLTDYLASLPASDNPNAYIVPRAASAKRTASLSNQFREILVEAGLVQPLLRGHKSTGKGHNQARDASEISFHSLRHSAVTMLKAAGVSDFIAREIVGHESAAISRQYTHLTTDDKRAAMQRLPDITNT